MSRLLDTVKGSSEVVDVDSEYFGSFLCFLKILKISEENAIPGSFLRAGPDQ